MLAGKKLPIFCGFLLVRFGIIQKSDNAIILNIKLLVRISELQYVVGVQTFAWINFWISPLKSYMIQDISATTWKNPVKLTTAMGSLL